MVGRVLYYPAGAGNAPIMPALKERILPLQCSFLHCKNPVYLVFMHQTSILFKQD